jgi:hypothetical protein
MSQCYIVLLGYSAVLQSCTLGALFQWFQWLVRVLCSVLVLYVTAICKEHVCCLKPGSACQFQLLLKQPAVRCSCISQCTVHVCLHAVQCHKYRQLSESLASSQLRSLVHSCTTICQFTQTVPKLDSAAAGNDVVQLLHLVQWGCGSTCAMLLQLHMCCMPTLARLQQHSCSGLSSSSTNGIHSCLAASLAVQHGRHACYFVG